MRLKIKYLLLLALFLPVLASGRPGGNPFLEPAGGKDTVRVADQIEYGVVIDTLEKGSLALFPDFEEGQVEFLGEWKLDTLDINKPEADGRITYKLRGARRFTSFDAGTYELPGIDVIVRNPEGDRFDTLRFEGTSVEFLDIPVDTATFVPHDIRGPLAYPPLPKPFPWKTVLIVAGILLALALIVFLVWFFLRRKQKAEAEQHKDPAYIVALRDLDRFRGRELTDNEQQKKFYSGITDVLRTYIDETFGISAPEMTTSEIFSAMKGKEVPVQMQNELRELFETADFVKFAKHMASDVETAGALPLAIRFVTETYQREVDKEAEKVEQKQEEK